MEWCCVVVNFVGGIVVMLKSSMMQRPRSHSAKLWSTIYIMLDVFPQNGCALLREHAEILIALYTTMLHHEECLLLDSVHDKK